LLRSVVSRLCESGLRRLDFGALDTTGRIAHGNSGRWAGST
jgi:hypothetical protein